MRVVGWLARWTWGVHWEEPDASAVIALDEFLRGRKGSNGERQDRGAGIRSARILTRVLRHAEELGLILRASQAGAAASWRLRLEEPPPEDGEEEKGFPVFRPDRYFAVPLIWHELRVQQPPALMVAVEALIEATFSFRQVRRAWMTVAELADHTGLSAKGLYGILQEGVRRGFLVRRGGHGPEALAFALRLRGDRVGPEGQLLEDLLEREEAMREVLRRKGVARAPELAAQLAERGWEPAALEAFLRQEEQGGPLSPGLLVDRLRRASPEAFSPDDHRRRVVQSWGRLSDRSRRER